MWGRGRTVGGNLGAGTRGVIATRTVSVIPGAHTPRKDNDASRQPEISTRSERNGDEHDGALQYLQILSR